MRYVFLGLSITSAWGNGHATTYRGLLRELARRGHDVTFLECDVPWYRDNRDLPAPPYCSTHLYRDLHELETRHDALIRDAHAVVLGSYLPDGIAVAEWVLRRAHGAVAFYDIDTPVTLAKLEQGSCAYLASRLVPRFDLYLSFSGGPTLERIVRQFGARQAEPLFCSVDPALYFPEQAEKRWTLGYLGTFSADRQRPLEELLLEPARALPKRAFVVGGPQYPESVRWPENVERMEHVAPEQHRWFYNRQRFTLNITRAEMMRAGYSPSVRLFEAAACGVPIISDDWPGREHFFSAQELLVARTREQVLAYLRELSDEARARIGAAARQRVLREHSAERRAAELDGYVHALHQKSERKTPHTQSEGAEA
jgi:spore maturation protein CgeB